MTIGERIKDCRERKQLTQSQLAETINTTKQTVYKYENNIITNVPFDKLEKIAEVLDTTPALLLGWENESLTISQGKGANYLLSDASTGDGHAVSSDHGPLTADERKLVHIYRHCSKDAKSKVLSYSKKLLDIEKEEQKLDYLIPVAAHNDDSSEEQLELMRQDLEDL